ncbi:MAG TPA: sucrase ferredoxin [Jatrophihabitans sp.]
MTDTDNRCSVLSRLRGDSMLGSAFEQGGVLLVEVPGPWGHDALTESRLDSTVATVLITRARAAGLRPLAIRHHGRGGTTGAKRWAVRPAGSATTYWGDYEKDEELLGIALDGSTGTASSGSTFLVCAHSKRDQCCAVFGRPIAAELEVRRPGQVWECSHTGGHRFAPVVLALPGSTSGGALYGRVEVPDALRIVAATEVGKTVPEKLRGEIGYSSVVQTALAQLQQQTGITGFGDIRVVSSDESVPGTSTVRLTAGDTDYTVTVEAERELTPFASCGKPDPKPQINFTAR